MSLIRRLLPGIQRNSRYCHSRSSALGRRRFVYERLVVHTLCGSAKSHGMETRDVAVGIRAERVGM